MSEHHAKYFDETDTKHKELLENIWSINAKLSGIQTTIAWMYDDMKSNLQDRSNIKYFIEGVKIVLLTFIAFKLS